MRRRLFFSALLIAVLGAGFLFRWASGPGSTAETPVEVTTTDSPPRSPDVGAVHPGRSIVAAASPVTSQRATGPFPESDSGRLLNRHWLIATTPMGSREQHDVAYHASLKDLRAHGAEASRLLYELYSSRHPDEYDARWLASLTLAELEVEDAFAPLRDVAVEAMPTGVAIGGHNDPTTATELTYRMVAVDGLARLAAAGHGAAEAELWTMAISEEFPVAVRARAIRGYLGADADNAARAEALRAALPEELHPRIRLGEPNRAAYDAAVATYERP